MRKQETNAAAQTKAFGWFPPLVSISLRGCFPGSRSFAASAVLTAIVAAYATVPALAQTALADPSSIAVNAAGELFIATPRLSRIFKASPTGELEVIIGTGRYWFSGDGGPARPALVASPEAVAVDAAGNLFIADTQNNRIRKVNLDGMIDTVVGNGTAGDAGDGGPATEAELFSPEGIAVDAAGNLFIADLSNHRIRKVSADGIITTIAGNGSPGSSGDGGPAISAEINLPRGVAVDRAGNVFFGEAGNRIRRVSADGVITTVAGTGSSGFSGDGGPGASAQIANARGVAVDGSGNLFIADTRNHRIRKVTPDGEITTVVGDGTCCEGGDGGPATAAQLNFPQGVVVDAAGNLFIADLSNRIRKVTPDGVITTFARNRN